MGPFQPPRGSYEKYYEASQYGRGLVLPAFVGGKVQKGHGLGSLIAGIARAAVPLVMPLMKSAGKAAASTALSAGAGVLADVIAKKGAKASLKKHANAATAELLQRAAESDYLNSVTTRKPTKRRAASKGAGPKTKKRKKRAKSTLF